MTSRLLSPQSVSVSFITGFSPKGSLLLGEGGSLAEGKDRHPTGRLESGGVSASWVRSGPEDLPAGLASPLSRGVGVGRRGHQTPSHFRKSSEPKVVCQDS